MMRLNAMPILLALICGAPQLAIACAIAAEDFNRAFAKADVNGNHTLDSNEYFNSFKNPVSEKQRPEIFARLDKNKDGSLSRDEYNVEAGSADLTDGVSRSMNKSLSGCGLYLLK